MDNVKTIDRNRRNTFYMPIKLAVHLDDKMAIKREADLLGISMAALIRRWIEPRVTALHTRNHDR